ncbi:MAG TPA: cellulase family glycosylhydrolase [Fimbriimonas sp.]|nr:cellulase family glycosylhydrolase [Fimbriimonas sp.]
MLSALVASVALAGPLPQLYVKGSNIVDAKGRRVVLKGTNLGNWFVIEPWMLNLSGVSDQYEIEHTLTSRFGEAEKDRLMEVYRSSWITKRDFPIIKSFGFNLVRLPMNYRQFEDDRKPFQLKKDAWKWIDFAIDQAEKNGLYTILDMHGVQGGQSVYDHTGHAGQNKLWTEEQNKKRLAWLWSQIAKRYKNRSAVVAYDVFNEPYGGTKPQQVEVFSRVLPEIRKVDPNKLVFAHGHWDDFFHYGNPKANGWKNVGFQLHWYPGLFGNGAPTIHNQMKHLGTAPYWKEQVAKVNVPLLIGEMNVVFKGAGGGSMMRRHFDTYGANGWLTTMWSYRAGSETGGHGDASWGMVTNKKPARKIDFKTASKAQIEAWMRGFATDELEVYADLKKWMTVKKPVFPPIPPAPPKLESTPHQDVITGWSATDLNNARKGGLHDLGNGKFALFGAGSDIWGGSDQARFLHQTVEGDFELKIHLLEHPKGEQYAKAGLMVRESLASNSAMALLSVFPEGGVQLAVRETEGGDAGGKAEATAEAPLWFKLVRKVATLTGSISKDGSEWTVVGSTSVKASSLLVGPVALSHDDSALIRIVYEKLELTKLP